MIHCAGEIEDDIDWVAAVAELENAEAVYLQGSQNGASHARQKTIDSFFGVRSNAAVLNEKQHNKDSKDAEADAGSVRIDRDAATSWIYPANVPRRDYQFSITKTALFANTLVSLPTGLGKTLIAAVVMYNFFRWFPQGKIVFTAPSKPLVMQQIEACHNVAGIPQALTIDMTGQISPPQRAELWKSKRVFFVTPQVLEKDIQSGTCPIRQLVCLVIDEAHRAIGNYSYCMVVREIMAAKVALRILALTATPGSKHATIQAVVNNLNISCMEYRDEDDPDVSQYTHNRKLELISVALNEESKTLTEMFGDVLQPTVFKLCNHGVFYNREIAKLTPYEFITAREKFRKAPPASLAQAQYGEVEACFGVAITLCHIFKLLLTHGVRPAFELLQGKSQKGLLAKMMSHNEKLHQIKKIMQQSVNRGAPSPKLAKMKEIVLDHFGAHDAVNTRIIIFTNFRESVKDIMVALNEVGDPIKAMEFIGQSSGKNTKGQSQKVQQQVLQKFRSGGYNTIVATCIGEEGLDIMEVDLVICFDANVSPLRMIQRMGRTGRKRDGRVVVLATEGTELQGYLNKQLKSKAIGKHLQNGGIQSFNFHSSSRMVPHAFSPELQLMELRIEQYIPRARKQKQDSRPTVDLGTAGLSYSEACVLSKYFQSEEQTWEPSLIAFPNFQLFPTPIQKIKHSTRTCSMLIDILQELRGIPSVKDSIVTLQEAEGNTSRDLLREPLSPSACYNDAIENDAETSSGHVSDLEWDAGFYDMPEQQIGSGDSDIDDTTRELLVPDAEKSKSQPHRCYFSSKAVTITDEGYVVVSSPPRFSARISKDAGNSAECTDKKCSSSSNSETLKVPKEAGNLTECTGKNNSSSPNSGRQKPVEVVLETPDICQRQKEGNLASPLFGETLYHVSPMAQIRQSPLANAQAMRGEQTPVANCDTFKEAGSTTVSNKCPSAETRNAASAEKSSSDWKRQSQMPSIVRKPLKRLKRRRELISSSHDEDQPKSTDKDSTKQRIRHLVDDEAEVSSDEEASADENEESGPSNDSFINDNTLSSERNSGDNVDMMAVYRRSLFTQSPAEALAPWMRFLPASTPSSRSCSDRCSSQATLLESVQNSVSITTSKRAALMDGAEVPGSEARRSELRKRKLSFHPAIPSNSTAVQSMVEATTGPELFSDDLFDGVDLDALEAEAAKECRSRVPGARAVLVEPSDGNADSGLPSFNLGI